MKKFILFFLFLFIFLNNNSFAKEKIVFLINEKSYTTIDIEYKINYLLFINKIEKNKESIKELSLQAEKILIEESLFNEFIKRKNISIAKEDIEITFKNIIKFVANENEEEFISSPFRAYSPHILKDGEPPSFSSQPQKLAVTTSPGERSSINATYALGVPLKGDSVTVSIHEPSLGETPEVVPTFSGSVRFPSQPRMVPVPSSQL